jgi:alpha-glucosidase
MPAQYAGQPLWWQKGIIYQIYPRSFKDSNGDGIGDLPGITDRLDYLQWLGVDAIWISPVYPSPMADFGYDVADYTDIDPIFGTLADFDNLLAQAHERNLKVILDFVPNHTSNEHPWFRESRQSRDNAKRGWYIWADAKSGGGRPNNWLSVFGGPAWEWDETTGQYYLHSFLKEQPDLNWRNPQVRRAMLDVLRFWLDRGVDGFRIDVIHYMVKDAELRDNPPAAGPMAGFKDRGEYSTQEHLYNCNRPEVHEVTREFRRLLDGYDERVAIGEVHLFDLDELMKFYGQRGDELHLPFNFAPLYLPWQAEAFRRVVADYEAALHRQQESSAAVAWPNYVLGNHDEHRLASRFGKGQARLAAMLLLTLRGTPTLYYGDEIGMADVEIPPGKEQDPWGRQVPGLGLGRDPERTPMQWDAGQGAGFSDGPAEPWLPIAPDYETVNVAAQQADPTSMLSLYRRLIRLRQESPALHIGSYSAVDGAPANCFAYLREQAGQRMLVALNFSAVERRLSLAGLGGGRLLISTHLDREEEADLAALTLRGQEGVIIELSNEIRIDKNRPFRIASLVYPLRHVHIHRRGSERPLPERPLPRRIESRLVDGDDFISIRPGEGKNIGQLDVHSQRLASGQQFSSRPCRSHRQDAGNAQAGRRVHDLQVQHPAGEIQIVHVPVLAGAIG